MSLHSREDASGGNNTPPDEVLVQDVEHHSSPATGLARFPLLVLEIAGGLALLALLTLTVSDALLRSLANRPVFGASDMIQVLLALVVAASLPLCVAAGRAIAIEMIVSRLPKRPRAVIMRTVSLTCAGLLGLAAWRCFVNASEAAMFGESTMLLRIGYGPFYFALAVSFLLCALLFARDALSRKEKS